MKQGLSKPPGIIFSYFIWAAFSAAFGWGGAAEAAQYPSRPITFIIPTQAGSAADLPNRLLVKAAEKYLGQPIVAVNKPGGSQAAGIAALAVSKPDGYTVGSTGHPGLFFAPIMEKVPYDPVRDFKQLMQFGALNIAVTVKGDSSFKNFRDLIAFARQNPKKLTYGTAGSGTAGHVLMELIAKKEGVQFTHIPFKGSPETQVALLGGHILVGTGGFTHTLFEAGQIRLVLMIAEKQSAIYPTVPIAKDVGYDIPAPMLLNVAAPKGLPEALAKKLEAAFTKAIHEPSFIKGMKDLRLDIVYRNSADLTAYVASNYEVFAKLLREMGLAK